MEGRILRRIWKHGRFDRFNLCTQTGQSLHVHFPGIYRPGPVPLFAGACLELDGDWIRGSVLVLGEGELQRLKSGRWAFTPPSLVLLVSFRNTLALAPADWKVPVVELSGKIGGVRPKDCASGAPTTEIFRLPAYICN